LLHVLPWFPQKSPTIPQTLFSAWLWGLQGSLDRSYEISRMFWHYRCYPDLSHKYMTVEFTLYECQVTFLKTVSLLGCPAPLLPSADSPCTVGASQMLLHPDDSRVPIESSLSTSLPDPSPWEAEMGGSRVPGQLGLHTKTLSQKPRNAERINLPKVHRTLEHLSYKS
jgi:hypothetical protein